MIYKVTARIVAMRSNLLLCIILIFIVFIRCPPTQILRMLGGCSQLRLPSWGGDRGSCIIDYVSTVQELLEDKVQSIVQSYVRRKECVAAFLSVFGQSVLEYDTDDFNSIAFLFELQGFSFIVKCEFIIVMIFILFSFSLC